jgi:nicotinamidase-related amidase
MMIKPELLDKDKSLLLLIDIQEKLYPSIHEREKMLARIDLLASAATLMHIPVMATEQYPKGLGKTLPEITGIISGVQPIEKIDFSCFPAPGFQDQLAAYQRKQIIVTGIEAHICVAQTALDLLNNGFEVVLVADGVGSRRPLDSEIALRRLVHSGAVVTTAESVVFEWLRRAGSEPFKALQSRIKNLV